MTPPIHRPTIVVAGRDPSIRKLVTTVLSRAGYQTVAAPGVETAAVIRSLAGTAALVICDVQIPAVNALDLAALQMAAHNIPVLYLCGGVDCLAVQAIARKQPGAILNKPFKPADLLARVASLLFPPSAGGTTTAPVQNPVGLP